jgi:hypothetical protein
MFLSLKKLQPDTYFIDLRPLVIVLIEDIAGDLHPVTHNFLRDPSGK